MSNQLFIAGGSVRAAAQSAVRAGFHVSAADVFCDRDLVACGPAYRVPDFPQGILAVAQQIPPGEWLYTGGLENEPALVDAVSRRHRLLGQPGTVLRRVRDPWQVCEALARAGLRFPRPEPHPPPLGRTARWLAKPLGGCGGTHIRTCDLGPVVERPSGERAWTSLSDAGMRVRGTYYQPWIRGPSYGALFLAAAGRATLLGVTRQLVGSAWAGARGFRYVGSIGPVAFDAPTRRTFQRIGDCLAASFSLRGLFGVDTIVAGPDIWTIEVNPRYTASAEILERSSGLTAVALHREACLGAQVPQAKRRINEVLHGKAVLFARADCVIGDDFYCQRGALDAAAGDGDLADLPPVGTTIRAGHPLLTVLTRGRSVREVHGRLRTQARAIHGWLAGRSR